MRSCDPNCHVRNQSVITSFLNRPHCAVGPSCESDWAEPLGYVDTLGDARFLVFRMFVLKHPASYRLPFQARQHTTPEMPTLFLHEGSLPFHSTCVIQ